VCAHVVRTLLGDERRGDDVALLVLQRVGHPADTLTLRLPAESASLGQLRSALRAWLRHVGATEAEGFDLTLAANEAAANVIDHAYGPGDAVYDVTATSEEGVVEIVVRDFGRWRPPRGANRGRGICLMEALADDVSVDHTGQGTRVRLRSQLACSTSAP
jgi:anti-sigma regulatory factor (Ser/Thr protein kinase)